MEGLTSGAYFFAFLGFLLMVVIGWLLIPRASFVITLAILVHKLGYVQLYEPKEIVGSLSVTALIILVIAGLIIDALIIRDSVNN